MRVGVLISGRRRGGTLWVGSSTAARDMVRREL